MKRTHKRITKRQLFFVVITVVCIFLLYFFIHKRTTSVTFIVLQDAGYYASLIATGEVVPPERIHLAAQITGRVQYIHIKEGEIADSGDTVITIDPRDYQLEYERTLARERSALIRLEQAQTRTRREAELAYSKAEEEYKKTEREYKRQQNLYKDRAISLSAFENTETEYSIAQRQLESAKLHYESYQPGGIEITLLEADLHENRIERRAAQLNLEYTKLHAPARVRVLLLERELGELVQAGEPIGILGTLDRTEIEVRIDKRFSRLGLVGTPADIWISGDPERKWNGRVVERKPRADAARGVRTSIVALEETTDELVPGTVVSVQLIAKEPESAHLIPETFITTKNGETGVWIEENGRATFIRVSIGQRGESGVVVRGDLSGGMSVLKPAGLSEGKRISLRMEKESDYEI